MQVPIPTKEQMALLLRSNGWQTLWSENYWIKREWLQGPNKIANIDWAGLDTEAAFYCMMKEVNENKRILQSDY